MISICLTTRERPAIFKQMCVSALANAVNPDDVEFISYHDLDDPSKYEYIGNHKEIYGDTMTISEMMNACYAEASGDICMFIADDFLFDS